jgi:glucuronate isomerase
MRDASLVRAIEDGLASFPWLDVHTHLDASHLSARGLHDVLLYHMVLSDLKSAGMEQNARLSEHPEDAEVTRRIETALPYLPAIANTSCMWGVRIILAQLYDWPETVTAENWRVIHDRIKERGGDARWHREVMRKAGVARAMTEWARRHDGSGDDMLDYCYELAFFSRAKAGVYDVPLRELEAATGRDVRTLADVDDAMTAYMTALPHGQVRSTAQHISTDIRYSAVSSEQMAQALANRDHAGPAERDIYASYLLRYFLGELQKLGSIVSQFSIGAEPAGEETYSILHQDTIAAVEGLLREFPRLHFQVFLASDHANQAFCSLARQYGNFSLAGYWWHSFFPPHIERAMEARLDMVSSARQVGFFSDAYCLEWQYAKAVMVRKLLARVLAKKIEAGQYTTDLALDVARRILRDTPQKLLGMTLEPSSS